MKKVDLPVGVLSFDQSANASGWSYWEDNKPVEYGVIYPQPKTLRGGARLTSLREQFMALICNYMPSIVLIENPVGGEEDNRGSGPEHNWLTMQTLCQVQGVLLQVIDELDLPVEIISPSSWQATCGIHARERQARKDGAKAFVKEMYPYIGDKEQDIYDSICIAFHYISGGKEPAFVPRTTGQPNYERSAF